ncbi:MAG: PDC sensor domain-containing protein [Desulfobacterales bacterium]|nr:MAG: PDC sensor domain-containing protein [Desulfobacterales bacterium]
MKKALTLVVLGLFLVVSATVASAEKAPQKVYDLANGKLANVGTDPVIVKAVKEENAKGKTLDQIKKKDKEWKDTAGIADYMKALMDSECGKRIAGIQKSAPYYAEIFVMDNQGANVAMTDKTSDYWQGDEAKFQKSFNGGSGAVFVDKVEFDDSTQAYLVQVSVPVKDGNAVIGAITFGIDVDKIE